MIKKTHFANSHFSDHCEAKGTGFTETYFTSNDFGAANINHTGVIDISDSVFIKCRYQNTAFPYFVRKNIHVEECSIVRRPS